MLVYIKPLSLFSILHSDTIFGALCSAVSQLYPDMIDSMIDAFKDMPPFTVSSAYPYIKVDDTVIRFYPKIMTTGTAREVNPVNFKMYKSIDYVEEDIFMDMINGSLDDYDIISNIDDYHINGNLLTRNEYRLEYRYSENIIPQNTINRLDNTAENIFYTTGYEFSNIGLYFMLNFTDTSYEGIVRSALKFLKDRGFGRNISIGKGQFDYKIIDDTLLEEKLSCNSGDYFTTLSRYIPTQEDIEHINTNSAYEISSKRGRSSTGEIRKQVRFFVEGSTFPSYTDYYGQIIESGTNAIEYGYAYPIGYNKK